MTDGMRLNLSGLEKFSLNLQSEIIVNIRNEIGPLVKNAGKTLVITTRIHYGDDLSLNFDSETDMTLRSNPCHSILGNEGGGEIFVRATRELRVCGPIDPRSGKQDIRRFLNAPWLLGSALANVAIHELGHCVAQLKHVSDDTNYMRTGGLPVEKRNMASSREYWAGKKMFSSDQKERLIAQFKEENWLGGMIK
jgi:hypothetical protein